MDPYDWLCGFLPTENQTSDGLNSNHTDPLAQAFKDMEDTISTYSQTQITNYTTGTGPLNHGLGCASINSARLQPQSGQHRSQQLEISQQQQQFLNSLSEPSHHEADATFATSPELNKSGSFQYQVNPQTSRPVGMAYQTTDPNSIQYSTHVVPSAIVPTPLPRYSATNQTSHPGHETIRPMYLTGEMNPPMGRAQTESQHPDQSIPVVSSLPVLPTSSHASIQKTNSPNEQNVHPVHQCHPIAEIASGRGSTISSHRSPPLAQELDASVSMGSLNHIQNSQLLAQSAARQDHRPTPIQSTEVSMRSAQPSYQNTQVSSTTPALNSLGGDHVNGHSNSPKLLDTQSAAPSEPHKGFKTPAAQNILQSQSSSAAHTKTSETPAAPMILQKSAPTLAKNSVLWKPRPEHTDGILPPAKARRLENGNHQHGTQPSANGLPQSRTLEGHVKRHCQQKSLKQRNDMVQPIDASLALAKVSYDSTTIARDVLVAAGKHPRRKRLNQHLEKLQRSFPKITFKADLQTFRWDLVDVKQPESFTTHTAVNHPAAVPVSATKPLSTWRLSSGFVQPSGLTSVPQLAFAGRSHPQSYISSRDRARAPATRPPPTPTKIDARAPPPEGTLPIEPPKYRSSLRVTPLDSPSAPLDSEPSPQTPLPSVSVLHHKSKTKHAHPDPPPTIEQNTAKHTLDPNSKNQQTEAKLNSGQVTKPAEAQHLLQPKVVISASPSKMSGNGRPGRPLKRPVSGFEVVVPRKKHVEYPVFPCQWEGCVAELHNIRSLQTHIVKNHVPHHLICKWKSCGNKKHMAAAAMFSHVSDQHISKMAWKLGDGPLVPTTVDTTANQPSGVADPSARRGTMILPVDEYQIKAFSKAHGIGSDREKANALIEAGRYWKQQVGPDLDQDCRRLSTPARQTNVFAPEISFSSPD